MPHTETLEPATGLDRAAAVLREGGLVAFPTETVYGLGADATNGRAVAGIFAAKDRPSFNPLICHVPEISDALNLINLPKAGHALAQSFWPGALTLVGTVRAGEGVGAGVSELVTAGLPTLAVRVPSHPLARDLLRGVGRPVAAPSANPSGRISPTTAEHVIEGLSGRIDAVLDGGPCAVGLESTIVGFAGDRPVLLRPGGVSVEDLARLVGPIKEREADADVTAPGQLASHYAPQARVVLNSRAGDMVLGFGKGHADLNLSPTGNLVEAAANLFAHLRALDARTEPGQVIAVVPIPEHGLGLAINDRLRRAAAPR